MKSAVFTQNLRKFDWKFLKLAGNTFSIFFSNNVRFFGDFFRWGHFLSPERKKIFLKNTKKKKGKKWPTDPIWKVHRPVKPQTLRHRGLCRNGTMHVFSFVFVCLVGFFFSRHYFLLFFSKIYVPVGECFLVAIHIRMCLHLFC